MGQDSLKKEVSYESIKAIALELGSGILEDISFIEEYLGEK